MKCKICQREYVYNYKKGHRNETCNSCMTTTSRKRTKLKAIKFKGGKCQKCGYNKSIAALCFHHVDPSTKEFGIGDKGQTHGWLKIQKEILKCLLLCLNCHAEEHEKIDSKNFGNEAQLAEQDPFKIEETGSIPVISIQIGSRNIN